MSTAVRACVSIRKKPDLRDLRYLQLRGRLTDTARRGREALRGTHQDALGAKCSDGDDWTQRHQDVCQSVLCHALLLPVAR